MAEREANLPVDFFEIGPQDEQLSSVELGSLSLLEGLKKVPSFYKFPGSTVLRKCSPGQIMCRQQLLAVRPFTDKEGIGRCRLALEPKVVLVEPRPFRAFQGWRYLEATAAPRDLDRVAPGAAMMPEDMRRELRELGLL